MNSIELAVNWFCVTQAEEKLKRDKVSGKRKTEQTHFKVRQKVRQAIVELGGTMPMRFPKPEVIIRQIESAKKLANVS